MKSEYLHWLPSGNSVFELVTAGAAAIPPNAFADLVVSIELPDENVISGTISDIGDIAVIPQGNQGEPYLEIVVSLEDTESYPEWTGASVTVSVTKKLASNVLAAPVTSLLAILGGGYAIEVIENGSSKLVPVSVGLYADGWVEINGEGINVGTEVVVP